MITIDAAKSVTTGFMSDPELEWLATQAAGHQRICEIGSWTGRSTLALAMNTKGTVWCVDTWQGSVNGDLQDIVAARGSDSLFSEFRANLADCPNVFVRRMPSIVAARTFEEGLFDMIFIDGSHDYNSIVSDIRAWSPKLIRGGLLCGHDYCLERWPDVRRAVDELVPDRRLMSPCNAERSLWWTNL